MRVVVPIIAALFTLSAAQAAEPYSVDVILTLTGAGAFLGHGEQAALVLAERAINDSGGIAGRPVKFIYRDDQTNPQTAVQLATEILAAKPTVVLGSSLVASCRAFGPLMQEEAVNYCFSPGVHPEKGSYVFSSSVSTLDLMDVQVRYFRLMGWKRLAVLVSTDATGQDAENGLKQLLAKPENENMELVELAHFNTGDVSVAAQIETIKAAKPQCVIAWATGTPIATTFRAMHDTGLDVPTATTAGNMTYRQMEQYAGFLPRRLYFASPQWIVRDHTRLRPIEVAAHDQFYKYFEAAGEKPDVSSSLSWDPAMIVTAGLRKLGPSASAQQLHDYLVHLKDFAGVDGVYDFEAVPQRGVGGEDSIVAVWSLKAKSWQTVSKPGGAPLE